MIVIRRPFICSIAVDDFTRIIDGGNTEQRHFDDLRNGRMIAHSGRVIFEAIILDFVAGLLKIEAGG
jgi:hypothetical protein